MMEWRHRAAADLGIGLLGVMAPRQFLQELHALEWRLPRGTVTPKVVRPHLPMDHDCVILGLGRGGCGQSQAPCPNHDQAATPGHYDPRQAAQTAPGRDFCIGSL